MWSDVQRKEFCHLFLGNSMSSLESDLKKEKKREITSHVGILGNEKSVAAAKSALSLHVTRMKLSATDILVCSRPTLNGADN